MLTLDQLIEECSARARAADPEHAVADYLGALLREHPAQVQALLGDEPASAVLHRTGDLTVVKVVMPPRYTFFPHDHRMWGVAAVVDGREDNTFYARSGETIEPVGGASYETGQLAVLADTTIHGVRNAGRAHTVGLHVYGGDLFATPASEWDPTTGRESRYDLEREAARKAAWVAQLQSSD